MKKVLVVYFSQTGQVAELVETITGPLVEDPSVKVFFEKLEPLHPYPFPWPFFRFASVMPESVLMEPPLLKPLKCNLEETWDLIILAYQPWYLSPSPPMTAFLKDKKAMALLGSRPVITVIACRGMWLMAQEKVKEFLKGVGAPLIGNIVLKDKGGMAVSMVTTVRKMFTGKKGKFLGVYPSSGISQNEVKGVTRFGHAIGKALQAGSLDLTESLLKGYDAVKVDVRCVRAEKTGRWLFRFWAPIIEAAKPYGSLGNRISLLGFYLSLVLLMIIGFPVSSVTWPISKRIFKEKLKQQREYYEWPSGSDSFHIS